MATVLAVPIGAGVVNVNLAPVVWPGYKVAKLLRQGEQNMDAQARFLSTPSSPLES